MIGSVEVPAPPANGPKRSGGSPGWRGTIAIVLVSMVSVWILSALALLLYTGNSREPTVYELTIPDGASELIAAGENPLLIPRTWAFMGDDTLVLKNEDDSTHQLGPWTVPAMSTVRIDLQPAFSGSFACTLTPDGQVILAIEPRDFDWRFPMVPTLLFGPALGLVIAGTIRVFHALDEEPDQRGVI